jgi:hypothetical protein
MTHRFRKQFNTHFTHTIFFVIILVDQVFRISEHVFVKVIRAQGSILPGWESITITIDYYKILDPGSPGSGNND